MENYKEESWWEGYKKRIIIHKKRFTFPFDPICGQCKNGVVPIHRIKLTNINSEVTCLRCKDIIDRSEQYRSVRKQWQRGTLTIGDFEIPIINNKINEEYKNELKNHFELEGKKYDNFKLKMVAIPRSLTKYNLYNILNMQDWNKIKYSIYEKYANKCFICQSANVILNCHEVWNYDDNELIQYLKECVSLCVLCHSVTHFTRALKDAKDGKYDTKKFYEHFMKINECDEVVFEGYRNYINDLEFYRSIVCTEFLSKAWYIYYGEYNDLVMRRYGDVNVEIRKNAIEKELLQLSSKDKRIDIETAGW